ncbi:MAG TPA: hypothetical protein VK875_04620, partial [Euzebyales bacterium]|nr:hypothetical protein [Euzebyales bacterium]
VGGAQVTGVVDVPGLPGPVHDLDDQGGRRHGPATQAGEPHGHDHAPAPRAGDAGDGGSDALPASSEQPGDGVDGDETADRGSKGARRADGEGRGQVAEEPGNAAPADDAPVADAAGDPPAGDAAAEAPAKGAADRAPAKDAADRARSAADRRSHDGEGNAVGKPAPEAGARADDEATKAQTPKGAADRADGDA